MKKNIALPILATLLIVMFANVKAHSASPYSFGVRITGKGRPMILIPGIKGSADTYNDIVAHYKDHYKCYVITLAGFAGQSPIALSDHMLREQRDGIIQFIIDKHLHKPVLTGFSFGGVLALWIATTRPDLTGPVVDLDGPTFYPAVEHPNVNKDSLINDHKIWYDKIVAHKLEFYTKQDSGYHVPKFRKIAMFYFNKMVTDTNRISQIMEWDKVSDYRSTAEMTREIDTLDLRERIASIQSPILLLGSWQGWDIYKTKEGAEKRYQDQFVKAKNVTIIFSEHGKHFLMYEDYDWMIAQMDKFLLKNN